MICEVDSDIFLADLATSFFISSSDECILYDICRALNTKVRIFDDNSYY